MDSALLSTFPAPLARLLLCGGGGLAPAWGPLHHVQTHEADVYPWDPMIGRASGLPGYLYDDGPRIECWSLPLDPASPWPARLAVVAAWMLGVQEIRGASLYWSDVTILTCASLVDGDREYLGWSAETGEEYYIGELNLPTLPSHLNNHDSEVALLLALWDVPELRARVEATQ